MSLDLQVSKRQTIATSFRLEEIAKLLAGKLQIPPHPEWLLPTEATWEEDPFTDKNWCFQFHMLRWLDPLRRAAARGDDAAFEMWFRWVRNWVEKNPPEAPRSPWAWTDMSDGIRAQQLCLAAPMIAHRVPEHQDWLEATIRTHAEHLADPAHMGRANHALHQQESLFICGRILHEEPLWQLALDRMDALLREQYDEQGVNAEGATAYHYNNYLWWEKALRRVDAERITRPRGADRHLSAPEEIAHATRPDGTLVAIGDTDVVSPKPIKSPVTDYVASGGTLGTAPADLIRVYNSGYVFSRSGWGDVERTFSEHTFFSLRFGPAKRVHGHPDGGSITYSAAGVNWLVDLGKYQYGSGIARDHFVSRAAHSLVSVEGRLPRRDATVTLLSHHLAPTHQDFLLRDDSYDGVQLTRRVVSSAQGEYLVVIDDVHASEQVTAIQRWQLGHEVEPTLGQNRADLRARHSRAVLLLEGDVTGIDEVRAQETPFDGWVSTGWKQMAPATAISARAAGERIRFVTVLAAEVGEGPESHGPLDIRIPAPDNPNTLRIEVSTVRSTESMTIAQGDVQIRRTDG